MIGSLASIVNPAELAWVSTIMESEISPVMVPSITLNDSSTSDSKSSVGVRVRVMVAPAVEPATNVTVPEGVLKSPESGVSDHPTVTLWPMAWERVTVYEASLPPSDAAVTDPDSESFPWSASLMVIQAGETVSLLKVPSMLMVSSPSTIASSSGLMVVRVAVPMVSPAKMVISEGRSTVV